jgi:hypothetical protein
MGWKSALISKVSEAQRCARCVQSVSKGALDGRSVLVVIGNTHQRLCTGKEHSSSPATATLIITGTGIMAPASALFLCSMRCGVGLSVAISMPGMRSRSESSMLFDVSKTHPALRSHLLSCECLGCASGKLLELNRSLEFCPLSHRPLY